jgi:hypothetical protein
MLYWHNPFPIYDATYVFKVYPRKKTSGSARYYTTFFWGNDGNFTWDGGGANTYYGAHPYPIPAPTGPGQWEISVFANDFVTGQEVEWDRWYTQVFRAWRESSTVTHHEFYWDWPDTSKVISKTIVSNGWAKQNPPTPAIVMGQAPNLNGASWGGYPGWEEFNGIIRGIQMYSGLLSLADLQAEIATPKSSSAGRNLIWYLNVDPRPGDVSDKKDVGTPHNPSWAGTTALEWSAQAATASAASTAEHATASAAITAGTDGDGAPPAISAVTATSITSSEVTIRWMTNELADSQVEYGMTSAYGQITIVDALPVTTHSVTLTALSPNTTYHVRVHSRDAESQPARSSDFTVKTSPQPISVR